MAQNQSIPPPPFSSENGEDEAPPSSLMETSSFVRQIVNERNFRWAAAFMFLALILVSVSLPPVWLTTPPGFRPIVRVSLLALLESRMLADTARKLDSEGRTDDAIVTWRQALFKNLGDHENQVGLLKTLIGQRTPDSKWISLGVGQAMWTLRLSNGSKDDRLLAGQFFAHYEMHEYVWQSLKPIETQLTDAQGALYLKSCFMTHHFNDFEEAIKRYPGAKAADPELSVYEAAWAAGWGPPSGVFKGKRDLAIARNQAATLVTANRLQLMVSELDYDYQTFSEALKALRDFHVDRPLDHVAEWRILRAIGRTAEARELARTYSTPPTLTLELRAMFQGYLQLELKEYASEFMQKYLPTLGTERDLWPLQAELLLELGRWDDLRLMAIDLRTVHPDLELIGYAWYLEGLVDLRNHLPDQAAYSFGRIPERPIGDPLLGFVVARHLTALGFPKIAAATLANLERTAGGTSDYWYNVTIAALAAGQFDAAAQAAEKAYQLRPDHPATEMNYAAVLLTLRTNSSLAAQLTFRLLKDQPDNASYLINHILALLQNGRLTEAEGKIGQVDTSQLNGPSATAFALAVFELRYLQDRRKEALQAYEQIQHRFLQAPQSNWVETVHRKLSEGNRRTSN